MQRWFLWTILLVLSATLVLGDPILEYQPEVEPYTCNEFKVIQKTFRAESETIDVGILCPRNSRVELYECPDESCRYISEGYKVNGEYPEFSGFEVGKKYQYQCYACEGTCVVEAQEGELVDLKESFTGLHFEVLYSNAPLSTEGTWQTTYEDEGIYDITIRLFDEHEDDTASFCMNIGQFNRPPVILSINNVADKDNTQDTKNQGEPNDQANTENSEKTKKNLLVPAIILFIALAIIFLTIMERKIRKKDAKATISAIELNTDDNGYIDLSETNETTTEENLEENPEDQFF